MRYCLGRITLQVCSTGTIVPDLLASPAIAARYTPISPWNHRARDRSLKSASLPVGAVHSDFQAGSAPMKAFTAGMVRDRGGPHGVTSRCLRPPAQSIPIRLCPVIRAA